MADHRAVGRIADHRAVGRIAVVLAVVLAVAPFVVGLVLDLRRGWLPLGDDAVIAERSWLVLTRHGPLLGQATVARSGGHATYDLGPLLYWLLALPVRIDPVHGVLWGAALWCVVAALVAVAAGRAAAGPAGELIAGAIFTVLAVDLTQMVLDPAWNPSIGLCWYVAAAACGVAVASGHRWWLPALVVAASIAAQSHLSFATGVVMVVPVALLVGLAATPSDSRRSWIRPVAVSAALGLGCWTATLVQQVDGHPGNLSALLSATGGAPVLGWVDGIRALGSAVGVPPLWSHQTVGITLYQLGAILQSGSLPAAGIVVATLVVVAVAAYRCGRHPLAALASVTLALALGLVVAVARFPSGEVLALSYSLRPAYVVALLAWVALGAAATEVALAAVRRRPGIHGARSGGAVPDRASPDRASPDRVVARRRPLAVAGIVALAAGVLAAVLVSTTVLSSQALLPQSGLASAQVRAVTRVVDRSVARGPVILQIAPDPSLPSGGIEMLALDFGVIWLAHTDGRDLRLAVVAATNIGPEAGPAPGLPTVTVHFRRGRPVATLTDPRGRG